MDDAKKPLPVVIVETLGWIYVMLSVLLFILAIVNACRGSDTLPAVAASWHGFRAAAR